MQKYLVTIALTTVAVVVAMIVYNKFIADRINSLEADDEGYYIGG